MSEVTVSVRLRAQAPEPEPPPERIPRAARVLALAHKWRALIRSGSVKDQAELARLVGVSRARITQVMGLLWLAPHVQEAVLFGEIEVNERGLRTAAGAVEWREQSATG
ncbi:MAG: hypothetical protein AB7T63_17405 [Planctomycetota bacterium]